MLKTLSTKSAKPRKDGIEIDGGSRAGCDRSEINGNGMDDVEVDGGEIGDNEFKKKSQKTSKSKNLSKSKKTGGLNFLIPGARLTFIKSR